MSFLSNTSKSPKTQITRFARRLNLDEKINENRIENIIKF
jgi:transcription initiation factor TFIIIB Brf1 subunit/transcription initiation factor TFIIB